MAALVPLECSEYACPYFHQFGITNIDTQERSLQNDVRELAAGRIPRTLGRRLELYDARGVAPLLEDMGLARVPVSEHSWLTLDFFVHMLLDRYELARVGPSMSQHGRAHKSNFHRFDGFLPEVTKACAAALDENGHFDLSYVWYAIDVPDISIHHFLESVLRPGVVRIDLTKWDNGKEFAIRIIPWKKFQKIMDACANSSELIPHVPCFACGVWWGASYTTSFQDHEGITTVELARPIDTLTERWTVTITINVSGPADMIPSIVKAKRTPRVSEVRTHVCLNVARPHLYRKVTCACGTDITVNHLGLAPADGSHICSLTIPCIDAASPVEEGSAWEID
jgi:hypothetical protein